MAKKEMVELETNLTKEEAQAFYDLCAKQGICPAEKIGTLVHGFILSEGVKHRLGKVNAA